MDGAVLLASPKICTRASQAHVKQLVPHDPAKPKTHQKVKRKSSMILSIYWEEQPYQSKEQQGSICGVLPKIVNLLLPFAACMHFQWYESNKHDNHLRLNAQWWNTKAVDHHSTYAGQKLSSLLHI
jgi:hypothetical protein